MITVLPRDVESPIHPSILLPRNEQLVRLSCFLLRMWVDSYYLTHVLYLTILYVYIAFHADSQRALRHPPGGKKYLDTNNRWYQNHSPMDRTSAPRGTHTLLCGWCCWQMGHIQFRHSGRSGQSNQNDRRSDRFRWRMGSWRRPSCDLWCQVNAAFHILYIVLMREYNSNEWKNFDFDFCTTTVSDHQASRVIMYCSFKLDTVNG